MAISEQIHAFPLPALLVVLELGRDAQKPVLELSQLRFVRHIVLLRHPGVFNDVFPVLRDSV